MFNVWLPAVLEDRAEGEGDEAIRYALKEIVLYSRMSDLHSVSKASLRRTYRVLLHRCRARRLAKAHSRRLPRLDRWSMDDPNFARTSQILGYMHGYNGTFDLCIYQGQLELGGYCQFNDHFSSSYGYVCCAM